MNSKDILILDDDIDLAMIASDALEDYGYTLPNSCWINYVDGAFYRRSYH